MMVGQRGCHVAIEVDELAKEVVGKVARVIIEVLPVEGRIAVHGLDPVR